MTDEDDHDPMKMFIAVDQHPVVAEADAKIAMIRGYEAARALNAVKPS